MALAAVSLSRIALIILPHGELTALSERYKSVNKVIEKIIVKQSFTNIPELEIITSFVVGAQKWILSINVINHSDFCKLTSKGAGLFSPMTFLTPLDSHSSCLITEITIPEINKVDIAR